MGDTSCAEVSAIKELLIAFDGLDEGGEFVTHIWLASDHLISIPDAVHIHTEEGRGSGERGIDTAALKLHASGWRRGMSMMAALQRFPA